MAAGVIGIFGTGVMAEGIARVCAEQGHAIVVLSNDEERAQAFAERLVEREIEAEAHGDLAHCDVFIEATVESLPVKQEVLREVEPRLEDDTIVATTTSSLSITELASALQRPERFVGLHFFNPVHRMRLVEVVPGVRTEPATVDAAVAFARALGKTPVHAPDVAGFIVNRLLIPYLNQAARLAESNVASPEDVDAAMTLGANHPMGPFALIDLIGTDVCAAIGDSLFEEYKRAADSPSPDMKRRVALGLLGRKTGRGYYDYSR